MKRHHVWLAFLGVATISSSLMLTAAQRERAGVPQQQPLPPPGSELIFSGEVAQIHAPRLFTVRERAEGRRELLVLAPRALSPGLVGAPVTVKGTLRRFTEAELKRTAGWTDIDPQMRRRFTGQPVLVAASVMAIAEGEAPSAVDQPGARAPAEPREPAVGRGEPTPLKVRAAMLVAHFDEFAGRQVHVVNGRVVGVLAPRAFLIEPATNYLKAMGSRDRVLVLLDSAALRVPADLLVGSTVTLTGIPRTLLGIQVTREVEWPAQLRPDVLERLEVRAAVLATSVQAADGIELTDSQAALR